jgi:transposase
MDRQTVDKFDVARQTVEKVRKRCVEEGLEAALGRRQCSRDRAPVLDGEGEAQLVAIAGGEPPEGRARWTLHLLADALKRCQIVHTISHETVRKVLKKTTSSRGANRCGALRLGRTPPSGAPWSRSRGYTPGRMMRPTR